MIEFGKKAWLRILVFLALPIGSIAQPIDLVPYSRSVQSFDSLNHVEALILFEKDIEVIKNSTVFGFSQNYFWILVTPPLSNLNERYVLDVDNPHIDRIVAYRISQGEFHYLGQSGDRIAFNQRAEENRRNVFHVTFSKASDTLLVMADKRNASVSVPLKLWKYDEFQRHESKSNMIYGLYFGMLLLIMLYSLLIFAIQRSSIYLWYLFYVLCLFIYLFVHVGYGFQFLFPNQYEWSNYLRLVMMVLIVIAQIRFTQLFLPVKEASLLLNKFYYAIIATLAAIIAWWIMVPGLFTSYTIIVINVVFGIIGVALLALIYTLFKCWRLNRTSVLFYGVAFGANVLATLTMIGAEYGLFSLAMLPVSPLFMGSFLEILIFAIGLSYRSKLIGDDRKRLLDNINTLQQQAMSAFLKGVEEEKIRVANELHDDIAARLSLLKMKVENATENELKGQITAITEEVRGISHRLNPVSLDENTFLEQVRKLVEEHKVAGLKINLQVFDIPNSLGKDLGLQLYRIFQEAMANIQKHAKAQEVDVQLFGHENNLILTIEDDGVGFDQDKNRSSLGTKNMRMRTEQLDGEFSISSAIGEGTSIMVSVPLT